MCIGLTYEGSCLHQGESFDALVVTRRRPGTEDVRKYSPSKNAELYVSCYHN
jgi:hypothetical protein